jgi:hypothetical protein
MGRFRAETRLGRVRTFAEFLIFASLWELRRLSRYDN